ncbi:hypothetical protein [Pendulispora albinea]|uniref:PEGA domain-containing protein n=1 Tax=Pendulispora albinea TaxID=2741071 RepID=A0ABZ2LIY2_9BACT
MRGLKKFVLLRVSCVAALGVLLGGARVAHAEDKAGAAALFAEAGKLVDAGQAKSACPKYEESLRLYESSNTRYFLADCYERVGRMASAWALFLEVAAKVSDDPAKVAKARERAAAVQPKVSHLIVTVEASGGPGLEVKRDGTLLGQGQWGVPMPIDAGAHVLEARAPGKKPWSSEVQVPPNGAKVKLSVPPLEDAPASDTAPASLSAKAAASPEEPRAREAAPDSGRRTLAIAVGSAGIVAMGVGTVLAFTAKSKYDEAAPFCNGDRCEQRGVDLRDGAVGRATLATVVFGVGVAGAVAGGVLWFTAPKVPKHTAFGVTPQGVMVRGTF